MQNIFLNFYLLINIFNINMYGNDNMYIFAHMNRKIKFRVWDNVDYMSTPFTLSDIQSRKIEFTSDAKIMQLTGLKDKNGNGIFEGDIVKTAYGKIGEVVYHNERASFIMHDPDHFNVELFHEMPHIEIIGNIYENPELLK